MRTKQGLILTEVLLSIALLAIAAIVVGSMIESTATSHLFSRNTLIAEGLAIEGMEAVKNIRDTSRLRYPDTPGCSLPLDPSNACAPQATENASYSVMRGSGGSWVLEQINGNALDLKAIGYPQPDFQLGLLSPLLYTHENGATPTPFHRQVRFLKIDDSEMAKVEVTVEWKERSSIRRYTYKEEMSLE